MITCLRCNETKPESEFQREKTRKSGYRGRCKVCEKETRQVPSNAYDTPQKAWKRHIKAKFGVDKEFYDALLVEQEGKCAICGTTDSGSKHGVFSIDHCHTNGHIRGLLCKECNTGLGMFKDNIESLKKAAEYLQKV